MEAHLLIAVFALAALPEGEFYPPPPPALETMRVVVAQGGERQDGWIAVPPPELPREARASSPIAPASVEEPSVAAVSRFAPIDEDRAPLVGLQAHAGLPDGFGASLVLRPWRALLLHLGGASNTMSSGLVGGVTLSPFDIPIAPTLTAEGGLFGEGDLSPALRWASDQELPEGELASGTYRFFSAHLGLEIGSARRFVFYVRGGLSWLDAALDVAAQQVASNDYGSTTLEPGELAVRLTMPSVKAGFTLYL